MQLRHATGMPVLDAREDFARARRAAVAARLLRGRRSPLTLSGVVTAAGGAPRLAVIPVREVVGTVEPTITFDAAFRPRSELVRARWERIALAHRRGTALPPIEVVQSCGGYYVVDGRHRVSVARSLGHAEITAFVRVDSRDRALAA